jgi:hypothetical protein
MPRSNNTPAFAARMCRMSRMRVTPAHDSNSSEGDRGWKGRGGEGGRQPHACTEGTPTESGELGRWLYTRALACGGHIGRHQQPRHTLKFCSEGNHSPHPHPPPPTPFTTQAALMTPQQHFDATLQPQPHTGHARHRGLHDLSQPPRITQTQRNACHGNSPPKNNGEVEAAAHLRQGSPRTKDWPPPPWPPVCPRL